MQIKLYNLHEANILRNYYQLLLKGKIFSKKSVPIDEINFITDKFQGSQVVGFYTISGRQEYVDILRLITEHNLKSPEEVLAAKL